MIVPVARVTVGGMTPRGLTMGIERELVMPQRRLATLRTLWRNGRVLGGLGGRCKHGRTARHQNKDRQKGWCAFHLCPALDGDV